jgi:hypothetical protein
VAKKAINIQATTRNPQTITTGPPVFLESIRKSQVVKHMHETYQTVEEQRWYTSHDADDRERYAKVLEDRE